MRGNASDIESDRIDTAPPLCTRGCVGCRDREWGPAQSMPQRKAGTECEKKKRAEPSICYSSTEIERESTVIIRAGF